MSFFSSILEKLGIDQSTTPEAVPVDVAAEAEQADDEEFNVEASGSDAEETEVTEITMVDVMGELEGLAAANPQELNWQTSIVDLLKLLELNSSLAARKELAAELQCPNHVMEDSAQMNMWLHKEVLTQIAANGGNIPDDMLG